MGIQTWVHNVIEYPPTLHLRDPPASDSQALQSNVCNIMLAHLLIFILCI